MTNLAELSKAQCAAIFVMLLDDKDASELLGRLEPEELETVGVSMCDIGDVDPTRIARAITAFVDEAEREGLPTGDRDDHVRSLISQAVGDMKAESMMQRIQPDARPRSLELARWLSPAILAGLVEQEHPQIISVLLLMLDPEPAAEVLTLLPEETQPRVVERIARLGSVSSQAVEMLDEILAQRIGDRFGSAALTLGGARDAANLINAASGTMSQRVMPAIEQRDAELAKAIEAEMFTFEMLLVLNAKDMGRLLRDVENEVLVDALKGLGEEQSEPFFAAMSSRAADGVRDEIEMRGRIRRSEVLDAQKSIIEIARRLADDGEISMGSDDGEFI